MLRFRGPDMLAQWLWRSRCWHWKYPPGSAYVSIRTVERSDKTDQKPERLHGTQQSGSCPITGRQDTRKPSSSTSRRCGLNPDDAEAHINLGGVLFACGQGTGSHWAIRTGAAVSIPISPRHTRAWGSPWNERARCRRQQGSTNKRCGSSLTTPRLTTTWGCALKKMGKVPEAAGQYEEALRINPELADTQNNLAWLLATSGTEEGGDPIRAVALAEQACKLTDNRVAAYLDTLAAAYAAAGRFGDAVATAQTAIPMADSAAQTQLVSKIEMRLELYRANRAYYEPGNVTDSRNP